MAIERTKRVFTFATFFVCTASLAFLSASLATQQWIVAKPVRISFANATRFDENVLVDDNNGGQSGKFRGDIYFGLFHGTKTLNYGFGDRISQIWIKEELMQNPNLMPFGLWLFTVLSIAIAILFGVVSSIFAIINTVMTPIEVITGLHGLFLWNGMGALFCTSACISWLIQYRNKLRRNVLSQEEIGYGWNSANRAWLGYSFFFVVVALALYLFNVLLVFLVVRRPWQKRKSRAIPDKNPEGVIMLY